MSNDNHTLPQGFEALERFLTKWDQPDFDGRRHVRSTSSMEEIRDFYDEMTPRTAAALELAEQYGIPHMPADVARLYRLTLALAHAAIAVEVQKSPTVPLSPYPDGLTVSRYGQPYP